MAATEAESEILGPIVLRPIFDERVWGVETLPDWYPQPAAGKRIGEAWLTAETCVAESSALRGCTLAELVRRRPAAFDALAQDAFPLLVKLLFPHEKLSVQVHPDDVQARAMGHARGKTECWYVVSAEAGAQIALGFREPLTAEQIRSAIEDRTIEDKLHYVSVKAGDMLYVEAGTVHAIGPGMVLLEIQEYSDVTYRLYDYGRPRELHVEAGLAVARTSMHPGVAPPVVMKWFDRLVQSPYFVVDRFTLRKKVGTRLRGEDRMQMLVALGEGCSVFSTAARTEGESIALPPGWVVVLPSEGVEYSLRGGCEVIRIAAA